jgi:signal transduction histidine kinase
MTELTIEFPPLWVPTMDIVTFLWSMTTAVALTLAVFCVVAWTAERRDLVRLIFCLSAVATAACAPVELWMMHARTPAEFGEWERWYAIPVFLSVIGQLLFVRFYLEAGRVWLLSTIVAARLFTLIANFAVSPNLAFREITGLRQVSLLGEHVVVADGITRSWVWFSAVSMYLVVVFVIDAVYQCWRTGTPEARRKALTVGLALPAPMAFNIALGLLVVWGFVRLPIFASVWFLGTLIVVAYEVSRDIVSSRRARLELAELRSELAQASRVTALGQLASSLAHELGQPLTAIMGNAEAASRQLRAAQPDLEELRYILGDIVDDDMRASEVLRRMQTLIKRRNIEVQVVALDDVVEDVFALVRNEAGLRNITVERSIEPGLPDISGDRVHIAQVLLNLVSNGLDAVQCRPPHDRHVWIRARTDNGAGGVEVAVSDSGPGISSGNYDKLFTPLFTTKSEGLGMGLALSRTIIEAHGGRLWAEPSTGERGTTFRFTLRPAPSNGEVSRFGVAPARISAERADEAPVWSGTVATPSGRRETAD